tara:strand:+ start:164 stop:505 length:342 start_codon:yes stop_codon:yes gene_type:complete
VKLEQLSDEAHRLFSAITEQISSANDRFSAPPDVLSPEALSVIQDLQEFTGDLQYRLSDLENIIRAYLQYVATNTSATDPMSDSTDKLSSMYEKITTLTRALNIDGVKNEVTD